VYEAQASLVIESLSPRVLSGVEEVVPLGTESFWSNRDFYETEYKILQSDALAQRVVQKLGLDHDLRFLGLEKLAEKGDTEALKKALDAARPEQILLSKLTIAPVKESKMVLIQYRDSDPVRAAQLATAHAQTYIEYNLERRLSGAKTAAQWLGEQLGDLKGKLEQSEVSLYNFKRDNDILAQSLEERNDLLKSVIEENSSALVEAQQKRIRLQARIEEIERAKKDESGREALPEVVDNENIQELRRMQIQLVKEMVQLEQRYGDKYPKLLEARGQLASIDQRIQREMDNVLGAEQADYRIQLSTEHRLAAELDKASHQALDLNKKSIDYNKLKRETENDSRLYGVVMNRLKETDLTGLLRTNNIRVVDEARTPQAPIAPRKSLNVMVSMLIGLALGLAVAFALDYLDNTIKNENDVAAHLGLTFLGLVPNFTKPRGEKPVTDERDRDLYVFHHQRSQVAECSRAIRTNITFMGTDKPIARLLVVSAKPDEGKTTMALNLATTLALSGLKTLVVDTDLRRPRLHRVFGFGSELGMSNVMLGERSIDEVVKQTLIPNLSLLPCGPLPPSPAELLHTDRFRQLVGELQQRFDRIIFDSPPMVAVTDAAILSSLCDGVVVVVKAGHTPRDLVRLGLSQLKSANARVLGVVLNEVDFESRQYAYYYSYYRHYDAKQA
jgi:capsular exopolysaccharide synthesis family protein